METNTVQNPLISFCMSTYKRPIFLKTQLNALLQQTYKNFEIIVSDNDLEQSAKDVALSFEDNRIKYFANTENLGMIKSFNKSIERSTGAFIIMITDDDPLYLDSLERLVDLSTKYNNYGVYAGCGDWIIDNESAADTQKMKIGKHSRLSLLIKENEVKIIPKDAFLYEYIEGTLNSAFLLWSCAMVRRDVLLKVKGIPDYGSEFLGDHAYMISVSSVDGMVFINKSLGGQLIHGSNFGYDFYKVVEKYKNTPSLFYNFLKEQLFHSANWGEMEPILWNYIGRAWVEYSLMLYHSLKGSKETKTHFFEAFDIAFSNKNIRKWKFKFFLKAYSKPLFNFALKIKKLFVK